ncbi:MAG: AAA family ATPase [Bradyrhizobium sp.]
MSSEHVERRLAAILAADVAGSCRLIGLDEEGALAQLKALRKTLFNPKINDHHGRVVKNTGDGALVEFASVVDALRCADEIQRRVAEQNTNVPQDKRIEYRIGIHVGDIIIEENDIFGDAVNVAVRLEGIAEPGGICISDDARRQVRAKIGVDYADMGSQFLKNIADPIRVWRVRANGLAAAPSYRPASPGAGVAAEPAGEILKPSTSELMGEQVTLLSASTDPGHQLVGRVAALETLERLTQHMRAGRRQIAFVTGEAGIGKTAFVETAMDRLSQQGINVLCGRCTERFGTDEAFLPLIDALVTRCRSPGGHELLSAIRTHAPTWMLQLPGIIDATEHAKFQRELFGATRERMLREFCDLVEALSASRPWAIVLEDLHWSDLATLDVLSRFARRTGKASVLIMGTYRPADSVIEGHPIRRLHQDLEIHQGCGELRLDRLSRNEVERYLAGRFADDALASTLSGPVFERTQGQPLFMASLLKYYIDHHVIIETDHGWQLSSEAALAQDSVPNELVDMITYQVARLTDHERRLLDIASVAGGEFSAALVAAGLSGEPVEIERELDALARKHQTIVTSGASEWPDGTYSGVYAFRHILYQNVIYQQLVPGQRVQTHRRLAKRLEEAYPDRTEIASTLALHFELGRDLVNALRYLGQAAESSTKRLGHAEAASYLTRALGILDRLPTVDQLKPRIALLRQRSWALRSCGDLAGSVRDLTEMIACTRQAGELRQEVTGLLAVSRFCLHADRSLCIAATEEALARSEALADDTFKALVQGSSASINLYLKGWREPDAKLCEKAIELTAGAQDHATLIRRYGIEGILDAWRSRYQECCHSGTEGKRLARQAGDIYVFVLFNVLESTALLYLGEWRRLQKETNSALEVASKNANRPAIALCRLTLAWLHVEAMDFEGARALCESVDDEILGENQFAYFFQRAVLAKAYVGLGQPARQQFDDVRRRMDQDGIPLDFTIFTPLYLCLGEYCLQIGDFEQARRWAIELRDYAAPAPDNNHLAIAYSLLARIAFGAGDRDEAGAHLSRALSIVENAEFPLAAWRVYDTAAEIFTKTGDTAEAVKYQNRFARVLRTLARNFEPSDRLHQSLLDAVTTRSARLGLAI